MNQIHLLKISARAAGILILAFFWTAPLPADTNKPYDLVNPLTQYYQFKELRPFKKQVESLVDDIQRKNPKIVYVTVYFRNLNDGIWFGINEKQCFIPASLLKVPVMMAVLKIAEKDPSVLDRQLECHIPPSPVSPPELKKGRMYSVDTLLEYMIRYSDNTPLQILASAFPQEIASTYKDLGIPMSNNPEEEIFSIKDIARFLRVLYNASYLNKEMSWKALHFLSQNTFVEGIRGGVPSGTRVANKYGSRIINKGEIMEIHEAAIVYYPGNAYLIAVSLREDNSKDYKKTYRKLVLLIAEISRLIYNELDSQYKEIKPTYEIQE